MYLSECMDKVSGGGFLTEAFSKQYTLSKDYKISQNDIKILSKNFGEVLAALYIIANNGKAKEVYFAEEMNSPFYDFVMTKENDMSEYYSVKSYGGSSTSMANLNFLMDNFAEENSVMDEYEEEIEVVKSLMNNKKEGITTIKNIETFFDEKLPEKKSKIIERLNQLSSYELKSLSQEDLDAWFKNMVTVSDKNTFIRTMKDIYSNVLGGMKAADATLGEMYDSKSGIKWNNGYIYYPMGSYITQYLNTNGNYLKALNVLLNYGTYIHQFDVNLYSDRFDIEIGSFKKKSFKFTYNGGAKYPGNRPIGFKEGDAILVDNP